MTETVRLDGEYLALEHVSAVARRQARAEWPETARPKVEAARRGIEARIHDINPTYGVTTGFGLLSKVRIDPAQLDQLQANLIRSHACGTGQPLSPEETRAALLIRANVLAKGFSGVRPVIIDTLLQMLDRGVLPLIPEKGSVGASGDLAPSAHLALVLMGEGKALYQERVMPGGEAMAAAGIPVLEYKAKEGLAVLNGTQVMSALGCLLAVEVEDLLRLGSLIAALSIDVLEGTNSAFDARIHRARPHPGQARVAAEIDRMMAGSQVRESHRGCDRVQDAYSLRCIPQVHGAVWDTLDHVRAVLEREINSATDNPLVFSAEGEVVSGGNFHGEPVAFALDFLAIAAAELAGISERRIERLINPDLSGLPAFLTPEPGLNSGYMIAQLTAVALVGENKILAHPASVDSLPTSANKEDHVSMGMTAALKLRQIVANVRTVLAIELLLGCQGLEFRRPLRTSAILEKVHTLVRREISFMARDRDISEDIQAMTSLTRGALRDLSRA